MKNAICVIGLCLFLSSAAFAQSIAKSLTFAQIASGDAWETVINVSNRGTTTYTGVLSFFTMSSDGVTPLRWNPILNGTQIVNGQAAISIPAGNTQRLTITAPSLAVGFGTISPTSPSDTDLTSFAEGTLTYYFYSGTDLVDSIGVEPSSRIYSTTIPFDNFSEIAFALANSDSKAAAVKLTVYSASAPVQVLGTHTVLLAPNAHVAEYLNQVFPGISGSTSGRLDIECETPVYGLALTQVGSQFSSLAFQPAVKTYTWAVNFQSVVKTGFLSARLEGALMDYTTMTLTPAQDAPRYTTGTFSNGSLFMMDCDVANNQIKYWNFASYSPSGITLNGTVQVWTLDPFFYLGQGTITLTATN
jgi:hypothetical protein